MIGHELTEVRQEAHHVIVRCECGGEWRHPKREGAVKTHGYHVLIQEARQALKGDTK